MPTSFPCLAHSLHAASQRPAQALFEGRKRGWTPGPRQARWLHVLHGVRGHPGNGNIGGRAHEHNDEKRW
ncbi:MAG: hypothetical protein K2Y32_11530 [Candidatus Obscuribacterales bacterium]|nr:hypothetical protein [Candidatus Obscuribacterales bacterium]